MSPGEEKHVVVIGAGVIGLTTALHIQEQAGYKVSIVAEKLPSDPKSIKYASHWAGAHHVTLAGDDIRQQELDVETYKTMWELSAPGGPAEGCFLRLTHTEYHETEGEKNPLHETLYTDFKRIDAASNPQNVVCGVSFTTFTIDVPKYLNYLLSRFLAGGGTITRGSVQHIDEVVEGGIDIYSRPKTVISSPVHAVVVCTGLGARTLGGVEDSTVFPLRGQTVLIRAPWVRFGRTVNSIGDVWTYIIPRRSGDVILGGTQVPNDWYPIPRQATTDDILQRAFAMCPELAPPHIRAEREPTLEDIRPLIIEEGCGLRPARKAGVRLEVEWKRSKTQEDVVVVHNYGHGPSGFQSSWGSASVALKLLQKALAEKR